MLLVGQRSSPVRAITATISRNFVLAQQLFSRMRLRHRRAKAATKSTKNTNGRRGGSEGSTEDSDWSCQARAFAPLPLRPPAIIFARVPQENASETYCGHRNRERSPARREQRCCSAKHCAAAEERKHVPDRTIWCFSWILPCRLVSLPWFSCSSWLLLPRSA